MIRDIGLLAGSGCSAVVELVEVKEYDTYFVNSFPFTEASICTVPMPQTIRRWSKKAIAIW